MSNDPTKHDMSVDRTQENIDKKVYMMPESYNALRRELHDNFPNLWNSPLQYFMAFDAPKFIQAMDTALGTITQFDSDNVDGICKRYLDELRVLRGLSRLHNPSEYGANLEMERKIRDGREQHEVAPWKKH